MNKKIGTNQNKFRSSTDVNNYNKFLLELDNKQIKVSNENKEIKENKEINCYVKNINQLHEKYKSTINQSNNQESAVDPNMYISFDPNRLEFMYEKQRKID